jgi:predicted RNase H-like nuclease (RuvC/YqgF family)
MGLVLTCVTAVAEGTNGPSRDDPQGDPGQQRVQDRLQTSSPALDQERTRLQECLPGTVQDAVKDMKKSREQYQQRLQEKKKELAASTDQERELLREQLRAAIKDQARDREQLRERLQALRESVPSHEQLMEQAREQVQQHDRRGD